MDPLTAEDVSLDQLEELNFPEPDSQFAAELTLRDRCDSCGAAAAAQVDIANTILLFCGHHFRKNEALASYPNKVTEDPTLHFGLGMATPLVTGLRDGGSANL